jgi:hypothetical protein
MRGGALPPTLLLAALGLALAFAPRRSWAPSLIALLAAVAICTFVGVPQKWLEGVFLCCWLSTIATAACVHLVRGIGDLGALGLSFNAGAWASVVVSLSGSRLDLLMALPWVLIAFPASWLVRRYTAIPVKVVSSWIIAIAVLAATLQLLPVTPGYLPDHME